MNFPEKLAQINQELNLNIVLTEDEILIFQIDTFDAENMRVWGQAVEALTDETVPIRKHIYDLRNVTTFPLEAIRAATRIKQNPSTFSRYVVVLVKSEKVRKLVDLLLTIQPGGTVRVMGDKESAVAWLNEQVKDSIL